MNKLKQIFMDIFQLSQQRVTKLPLEVHAHDANISKFMGMYWLGKDTTAERIATCMKHWSSYYYLKDSMLKIKDGEEPKATLIVHMNE